MKKTQELFSSVARAMDSIIGRMGQYANRQNLLVATLLRHRVVAFACLISFSGVLYWALLASDIYVSEAHIIIQDADLGGVQSLDLGGLLGVAGNSNKDQLLLRDYLLSVDMMLLLDKKLDLKEHFSRQGDLLSRLYSNDVPLERFHKYYLSRVSVEYDSNNGILTIQARAFKPDIAQAMVTVLMEEGERYMNHLGHQLALEQVRFLEKQVGSLLKKSNQARRKLLEFQNRHGLASPELTVQNVSGIINDLDAKLTELRAQRDALLGFMKPGSPKIVELEHQIAAIRKQLDKERARLVSSSGGGALNAEVEEFQRLQMDVELAQEMYKTALLALEKGRIEASRTLKMVSVLQSPTHPQYPIEPRRAYNSLVFSLFVFMLAGLVQLLRAIIRDHRD